LGAPQPGAGATCEHGPCAPCPNAPCAPGAGVAAGALAADAEKKDKDEDEDEDTKTDGPSVTGVRLSRTVVRGSDADSRGTGLMFAFQTEKYRTWSILTTRASSFGLLGGGSGGFEGGLGASFTAGARLPVASTHGPFARVGAAGSLQGNDAFYFSYLELPEMQAGYQYQDGQSPETRKITLEIGARTGPVLTGRYTTGQNTRSVLSGFEWGGYGAVHLPFGRLDAKFARFPGTAGPVDVISGIACGHLGKTFALCVDGMLLRGDAPGISPARRTDAIYVGGTVGLLTW
jgi:hypothetical protein